MTYTTNQEQWDLLNSKIINCRKCPRLVSWRENVASIKRRAFRSEKYWGRPVPGFGDVQAKIIVVGLAPGAHGSNRTGRMFTGDKSGQFLYRALYQAGFANQPISIDREDGLKLNGLFISALCRCVPPANKPTKDEIRNCRPFLEEEIDLLVDLIGFVSLGQIAFSETSSLLINKSQFNKSKGTKFFHGAFYSSENGNPWILASYHPSQQNTQTGRLTVMMFEQIWIKARLLLDKSK